MTNDDRIEVISFSVADISDNTLRTNGRLDQIEALLLESNRSLFRIEQHAKNTANMANWCALAACIYVGQIVWQWWGK